MRVLLAVALLGLSGCIELLQGTGEALMAFGNAGRGPQECLNSDICGRCAVCVAESGHSLPGVCRQVAGCY